MQIKNFIPEFLSVAEIGNGLTLAQLDAYWKRHPSVFNHYFPIHCPKTEERLNMAISKYPNKLNDIRTFSERISTVIEEVDRSYRETFQHDLSISYTAFVGTFGSNAFVTRKIKGDIYFAAEKLSPEIDHLKVIVAHEIGHVTHFSFAEKQGMDWSTVDWMNGLTTVYTEGAATYLSKKIVPALNESIYFTYDDEGAPWVECYEANKTEVKRRFLEDVSNGWDMEKEREWFRLSGGSYFGHNRLGYLLGTDYVEQLVTRFGEEEALTFWHGNDLKNDICQWLLDGKRSVDKR